MPGYNGHTTSADSMTVLLRGDAERVLTLCAEVNELMPDLNEQLYRLSEQHGDEMADAYLERIHDAIESVARIATEQVTG